jgi:phosphopantetheinyl transferase
VITVYYRHYPRRVRAPDSAAFQRRAIATHLGPTPWCYARMPRGKPYVRHDGGVLRLSVSHSADLVVVACAEQPCGIDVERQRRLPFSEDLAPFLHPEEVRHLRAHPDDLLRLFAAKECHLKLLGCGIAAPTGTVSVLARVGRPRLGVMPLDAFPGYVCYVGSAGSIADPHRDVALVAL